MATTTITGTNSIKTSGLEATKNGLAKYDFDHLEPYVHPPETKESLPWAELVTLDLSKFSQPGGKEKLAKQLEHAVHHVGFFYVKNFDISQDRVDRQFTLAHHFYKLPVEEKAKYECDYAKADYNGWRRPGRRLSAASAAPDNIEIFNIPKFTDDFKGRYDYPDLLKAHMPEIESFSRALHENIVLPLLKLFAIVLKLPDEDYLARQHTYEQRSEDHFRYMIYHKRTPEQHAAARGKQTPGHTDLGTLTLLFRQPIAGLQILGDDGKWTYVSAQPGTVTVNLADTISHLTGGYLKSSVHRVVTPPEDQWQYDRTGLLYFVRPHSDLVLHPITDSPVLEKAGVKHRFDKPVTMAEWVKAKQTLQLNPEVRARRAEESKDGSVEVLAGFRDKKYD